MLTFGDGDSLEVGEILGDPAFPTTLAFPARTVSSVRFTVTRIAGSGTIGSGRDAGIPSWCDAVRFGSPSTSTIARDPDNPRCTPVTPKKARAGAIHVLCPLHIQPDARVANGSHLRLGPDQGGRGRLVAREREQGAAGKGGCGPLGASQHQAESDRPATRPGDRTHPSSCGAEPAPQYTDLLPAVPRRWLTASAPACAPVPHPVAEPSSTPRSSTSPSPSPMEGRNPGADYPAGQAGVLGAAQFGEAIFPDPAIGFGNLRIVDSRYLRMAVCPTRGGITTPTHGVGATSGRSSRRLGPADLVSATRYGHFEARILAPAAPGTWPAVWLMPSDNLIEPRTTVAEIDAVELYGHDPRGTCHSTHSLRRTVKVLRESRYAISGSPPTSRRCDGMSTA